MMRICSEEVDISIQRIIMMMLSSLGGATLVSVTVINTYKSTFIILTTISRDPINYNIVEHEDIQCFIHQLHLYCRQLHSCQDNKISWLLRKMQFTNNDLRNNQQNELTVSKVESMISVTECLSESDCSLWAWDLRFDLSLRLPVSEARLQLLWYKVFTARDSRHRGNPRSSSSDLEKCLALINSQQMLCCWVSLTNTARCWVMEMSAELSVTGLVVILSLRVLAGPGNFYK